MPGASISQSATCFIFLKTGTDAAPAAESGAIAVMEDDAAGEEAVWSAEDADPTVVGDEDVVPPFAATVDAMIGPFELLPPLEDSSSGAVERQRERIC